jgi:dienelactone hydrolase
MQHTDTRIFRLVHPDDPRRIIRGRAEGPRGFLETNSPLPHVVVLHGFKGFMDWGFFPEISRRIASNGMVAVRFNMSGSGIGNDLQNFTDEEAFAHNTCSRELEDLERVREWIRSGEMPGIDARRAALFGHSRGGGIALLHAAERDECRSIVTWAAISDVDRFDAATKSEWRKQGFVLVHNSRTNQDLRMDVGALDDVERNRARLDIIAACRRVTAPTLLIHGSADQTVSADAVEQLSAALDPRLARKLVIEGANHTFGAVHPMRNIPHHFTRAADETIAMIKKHWS